MSFKNEQENFWASDFGTEYTQRNGICNIPSRIARFAEVLKNTQDVNSFLELGANVGSNLIAIKNLKPDARITALEINKQAYNQLKELDGVEAINSSILEFESENKWDFVFTSGVLIHICPDKLNEVYRKLYNLSRKYIWICEYYNPTPVEVEYRGNEGKLFKRDFAGEMLDLYKDLSLQSYGFNYHRDNNFPTDDATWFLLKKLD